MALSPKAAVSKAESVSEAVLGSNTGRYPDDGRIGYGGRFGQLALDAVHVVLQGGDSGIHGCNSLTHHTCHVGVLVFQVELRGQRAVLLAQGVDLVLQSCRLQLVELGEDSRGSVLRSFADRALQRVGLLTVCQTAFVALALDGGADIAAAGGHLRKHLCVAGLYGLMICCAERPDCAWMLHRAVWICCTEQLSEDASWLMAVPFP